MSCPVVLEWYAKKNHNVYMIISLSSRWSIIRKFVGKESTILLEVTGLMKKGCDMLQYKSIVFLAITQLFINVLNTMHSTRCMVKGCDDVTHGTEVCDLKRTFCLLMRR